MSTKIFFGVIALITIIAGYVVFNNYNDSNEGAKMGDQVSFSCQDGTAFIAEFSFDMSKLNVVVDGEVKETLPNMGDESVPYRFGDDKKEYTFVGEEAIVANLESGESKVCNQPLDANNAPYNFGDRGEGGGTEQDVSLIVSENILGTWQSTDDEKFSRTFQADGVFTDRYEGGTDTTGNWLAFTAESDVTTTFPLEPNTVYLRLITGSSSEDALHFSISKLTPEELELVYMERGGTLKFRFVGE